MEYTQREKEIMGMEAKAEQKAYWSQRIEPKLFNVIQEILENE